jgi:phosphopantothenoylcysteine synthetase/decarboxylase
MKEKSKKSEKNTVNRKNQLTDTETLPYVSRVLQHEIVFGTVITASALRTMNHFRMEIIMIPDEPMNTLEGISPQNTFRSFETPALTPLDFGQCAETGPGALSPPFLFFGDEDEEDDEDIEEDDAFDDMEDDFDDDFDDEDDDFDDEDDDFEEEDDDFDYEEEVDYDDFDE